MVDRGWTASKVRSLPRFVGSTTPENEPATCPCRGSNPRLRDAAPPRRGARLPGVTPGAASARRSWSAALPGWSDGENLCESPGTTGPRPGSRSCAPGAPVVSPDPPKSRRLGVHSGADGAAVSCPEAGRRGPRRGGALGYGRRLVVVETWAAPRPGLVMPRDIGGASQRIWAVRAPLVGTLPSRCRRPGPDSRRFPAPKTGSAPDIRLPCVVYRGRPPRTACRNSWMLWGRPRP